MQAAARSKDYPRCSERRHFRRLNAIRSVEYLEGRGLDALWGGFDGLAKLSDVMSYVQDWVGFGPWISFKVADMLERLNLLPVEFSEADTFLFDSPKEGAQLMLEKYGGTPPAETWAVKTLQQHFGDYPAPPRGERPVNGQEMETILCKWKSHLKGKYHIGEDIEACRKGLNRFPACSISRRLYQGGKKGGLW